MPKFKNLLIEKKILMDSIKANKNKIWKQDIQNLNYQRIQLKNNSWMNCKKATVTLNPMMNVTHIGDCEAIGENEIPENIYSASRIDIIFTREQKRIIDRWMNAGILMYNETIDYLKAHKEFSWFTVRKELKNTKNKIINKSAIAPMRRKKTQQLTNFSGIPKMPVHCIDSLIQLAVANFKSATTNKARRNIGEFRLRHWKFGKKVKFFDIEAPIFHDGTFFSRIFNKVRAFKDNHPCDFSEITSTSKLFSSRGKYYLMVPHKLNHQKETFEDSPISIDLGIRTFATGITEDKVFKIGTNCINKLSPIIGKIEKAVNNKNKRRENQHRAKLKNMIDELHWKSINYLTSHFSKVIIGKLSTKAITSKKLRLPKIIKKVTYALSFFKFFQRLKYKCDLNNSILKVVDESYTSKICSYCCKFKADLGSSEIYNCSRCKMIMDRDVNGARGIYFKSF